MAEWLRRQTRNLLGSARAGSNPADDECFAMIDGEWPQCEVLLSPNALVHCVANLQQFLSSSYATCS